MHKGRGFPITAQGQPYGVCPGAVASNRAADHEFMSISFHLSSISFRCFLASSRFRAVLSNRSARRHMFTSLLALLQPPVALCMAFVENGHDLFAAYRNDERKPGGCGMGSGNHLCCLSCASVDA